MIYAGSHRWFTNVRWPERKCFVECVVDIQSDKTEVGHFVVLYNGQLILYSYEQLVQLADPMNLEFIGKAISWDHGLIKYELRI